MAGEFGLSARASRSLLPVLCVFASFLTVSPGLHAQCSPVESAELFASTGAMADSFGMSVLVSGDVAVVGAPSHDDSGSAFVYTLGCLPFRRGDCNQDGGFDVADPFFALSSLFVPGSPQPDCRDACDTNDDGSHNLPDAVYSLTALFINGPPPAAPYAACGPDPTPDLVDCAAFDPGACP